MSTAHARPFFWAPPPTLTVLEARFLRLIKTMKLQEALMHLTAHTLNVNQIIDHDHTGTLFSAVIDEFQVATTSKQNYIFRALIHCMIKKNANINAYDAKHESTLFTRLCNCEIDIHLLTLMINHGAWINPEEHLTEVAITRTPLGELASKVEPSLVKVLCQHGANPNTPALTTHESKGDIFAYVIDIAEENEFLEDHDFLMDAQKTFAILEHYGANISDTTSEATKATLNNIMSLTQTQTQAPHH